MKTLAFVVSLGLLSILIGGEKAVFTVQMQNGGAFKVFETKNSEGNLMGYNSNIVAPVCEDGVCYNVNVAFSWNVIGEFMTYKVTDGFPLTKLDHIPFMPEDYKKLQSILTNHDLVFTGMEQDKLVKKTKLDATSGATVEAIKNEVIEGALFTCYTLWHIANGAVMDSIQNQTARNLNQNLVKQIANINSSKAPYFLINSLKQSQWEENIEVIFELIKNGKGYFPKNAFEKTPKELFKSKRVQEFLVLNYSKFSYFTKLAVLQKLESQVLNIEFEELLLEQVSTRSSFENSKIIDLLLESKNHQTILLLKKKVENENILISMKQKEKLDSALSN